jgi:hypothetical protein
MVLLTEYHTFQHITASVHCKYTHHAVHTANINNSVHCTCMYHVLLHIRFTLFTQKIMNTFSLNAKDWKHFGG